jgi:hypothetical protein
MAASDTEGQMARPKMIFAKASSRASNGRRAVRNDYRIYVTYRRTVSGAFMGELEVIRTTDARVLFFRLTEPPE